MAQNYLFIAIAFYRNILRKNMSRVTWALRRKRPQAGSSSHFLFFGKTKQKHFFLK